MIKKNNRTDSQKKADSLYEKKRSANFKMFGARFTNDELQLLKKAVDIVGSNKNMILEGAELIIKNSKNSY